jgi:hypothetical protein
MSKTEEGRMSKNEEGRVSKSVEREIECARVKQQKDQEGARVSTSANAQKD